MAIELNLLMNHQTAYIKLADLMDYLTENAEYLEKQAPLKATFPERQRLRNGAEFVKAIRDDLAVSVAKAR